MRSLRAVSAGILLLALSLVLVLGAGAATGAWRLLPILSGSMRPAFAQGSLVLARPVSTGSARTGSVLVFRSPVEPHRLIAHRIVRVLRPGPHPTVRTRGDANTAPDPWSLHLTGSRAWVVRADVPLLGYAAVYARRALLVAVVALVAAVCARRLLRRVWS